MIRKNPFSLPGTGKLGWGPVAACVLAVCLGLTFAKPAMAHGRHKGHAPAPAQSRIYVESNDPSGNVILAYQSDSAGNLTLINSYPTGGNGLYTLQFGPYDSDGNVILNSTGTLLFAVNSGSNNVSVFDVNSDGTLTSVSGSPFPSGGTNPVGLGLSGNTLIVVNKSTEEPTTPVGVDLPNYSSFTIGSDGSLSANPVATLPVAYDSSPSQALGGAQGGLVFGDDFTAGLLRTFKVSGSGQIRPEFTYAIPDSLYASPAPHWPLGMAVNVSQRLLYVGLPTASKVAVYSYDAAGHLSFQGSGSNSGKAVCWLALNASGSMLYTVNNIDASVSTYSLSNPESPAEIQHLVLTLPTTSSPFQEAIDPSGKFLYVVGQSVTTVAPPPADAGATSGGNVIHVLSIDPMSGQLTELPSSPVLLPVSNSTRVQGIAVF